MDRQQACFEIRWRTLDLCNSVVRRVLAARNSSFTWNVASSGIRYCPNKEPAPPLYQHVSNIQLTSTNSSVTRLRDLAPDTSTGFASMRERRLFSFHQELLVVKPVEEPLTLMTLASFTKDQIMQAISDLSGKPVISTNYRTTFLQYLQLCRRVGIQFRVPLTSSFTQCLTCFKHAQVSSKRFKCACLPFQFNHLQDCNCECGTSFFCCTCDELPPICYDLDILADIVSAIQQSFRMLFIRTDLPFTDMAMSLTVPSDYPGERVLDVSSTIRLSQFEPP